MNQQNQGPGVPSNVPMKRKRGRPRKEENVIHGVHKPENVLNFNQSASIMNNSDSGMLGKMVTGVIEAAFNDGYLVNVKVADSDSFLRGVVFLPGQVTPVTAENDVAPHVQMIKRKEFPIPIPMPMPNPQTNEVHLSLPTLKSIEPQIPAPFPGVHILPPTEVRSGISVPPGISEAEHVNQSNSLKSVMDCDKTVEQNDKLNELNASTQVEESSDDPRPASETMNLFPTIENTNKELRSEHQVFPSVNHLNELVHNEPNNSNIELNLVSVSAEREPIPSEQHNNKSVEIFVEKQTLPETDLPEDAKTKPVSIDTLSNVDNMANSNGKPSTGIANILDMIPNHAVQTNQHESMQFEQIGQHDPSNIKLSSEGNDFMVKSDTQNCSSLGDINKVDFDHPIAESLVDAVPSENQIGAGT